MKITRENMLDIDTRTIKITDVMEFVESEGLEYRPDLDVSKKDMLVQISELLKPADTEQTEPEEQKNPAEESAEIISKAKAPVKAGVPPYLVRREKQISAANKLLNVVSGRVDPESYDKDAPDYIKRRFSKGAE